ncbi:CGNR zinc finger domain-containing protein [Streptosporangium sp. NPDC000396]|uniref:CGNR zinc finger domain-containing protein n=1 Tax=Streptosporangium sp. NPDC000396 TaxID=3366185 RepID=UPI00369DDBCC
MDVTGHLRASLDAAIALANHFGARQSQGRDRDLGDEAEKRSAIGDALRLATRRMPPVDEKALGDLESGGAQIYAALELLADGHEDSGARAVNALLKETRATPSLVRHDGDPWHLHFAASDASEAGGWLADLVTAVAVLVGSADVSRLHRCGAERCDNLFLDATRSRTQRFCSTACQNRTKVAAFRAREDRPG